MYGRLRLLVIDDCVDTLELLKTALEKEYEVFGLGDPERVDDAVEVVEPDFVMLDLMMPRVSGFDILERINGAGLGTWPPIIVLSAKRKPEDLKRAYALGAKLFITKPFEPERLLRNLALFREANPMSPKMKRYKFSELDHLMNLRASFRVSAMPLPGGLGVAQSQPRPSSAPPSKLGKEALAEEEMRERKRWRG